MSDHLDPKFSEKAINRLSYRVCRRLHAAGDRSLTMEDVRQELWCAWCIAQQSYNAEMSIPFLAYLQRGMMQHINRYVEKHVSRRHTEVIATSLDATPNDADGDGQSSLHSAIPSADPSPDNEIMERSAFEYALKRLQPRAKVFLKLLYEQPPELLNEVRCLHNRTEYARSKGVSIFFINKLSAVMIFDVMGASVSERSQIMREIKAVGEKMNEGSF